MTELFSPSRPQDGGAPCFLGTKRKVPRFYICWQDPDHVEVSIGLEFSPGCFQYPLKDFSLEELSAFLLSFREDPERCLLAHFGWSPLGAAPKPTAASLEELGLT